MFQLSPAARAQEAEWPGTTPSCRGDDCVAVPTPRAALDAYDDVRAQGMATGGDGQGGLDEETWLAIGAAATATTGIAYGTGRYLVYRQAVAEAARHASLLRAETRRVAYAITQALAPELQRYGRALVELQRTRGAALEASEVEAALSRGLNNPETRRRILASLRSRLGAAAESTLEKILTGRHAAAIPRSLMGTLARVRSAAFSEALLARELRTLGAHMAHDVARAVAPSAARLTVRAAMQVAASAASRGLLSRCGSALVRIFGVGLRVAGSAWLLGATILLEPSIAHSSTMDGYYAAQPDALFELPEEQARYWIRSHSNVRMAVMKVRDVMRENGDLGAISSETPLENEDMSACLLEPSAGHIDEENQICE